jgi:F-type H+-transporting ATPase subunit delta
MQEKLTQARPYAAAAFDFAVEHGDVDAWAATLDALARIVKDRNMAFLIGHPKVGHAQLMGIMDELFGAGLSAPCRNFIDALVGAERLELAPEIATLFAEHRARAAGRVKVEVRSAYPLSTAEQGRIDAAIRARLGKDCEVESAVDPALIGGAVIRIGDSVIDLSLRGRLTALAQTLA